MHNAFIVIDMFLCFYCISHKWVKIFKNRLSKICGRQPLKNLKWYGLPSKPSKPHHVRFLAPVFHKFYVNHSWIPWPKCGFNLEILGELIKLVLTRKFFNVKIDPMQAHVHFDTHFSGVVEIKHWGGLGQRHMNGVIPSKHLLVQSQQYKHSHSRKRSEIYLKLTIKTLEWLYWGRSDVFIVSFEHILHLFLVFILLILNK